MNDAQRILLKHYENGDFAERSEAELRSTDLGDGLLRFLFIELSEGEDCDNLTTALSRMDTVLREVSEVHAAIYAAFLKAEEGASLDDALDAEKTPVAPAPGP